MKQFIIFTALALLSQGTFAQDFTLTAKCGGWKMESGEGQIKVLEDFGSETALIVFDQLSGEIYSENASTAKVDKSQSGVLKLSVGASTGRSIDLTLREGKSVPTYLLVDGKQTDLLSCSYGYNNL